MTDTEKRDAVLKEFCEMAFSSHSGNEREERMAAEIVKLRAILAKLREPSVAVGVAAYNSDCHEGEYDLDDAIRAAVAAAEQEVGA